MDVGELPNHVNTILRVIIFLWRVFSLFLFLIGWQFRVNSLQLLLLVLLLLLLLLLLCFLITTLKKFPGAATGHHILCYLDFQYLIYLIYV